MISFIFLFGSAIVVFIAVAVITGELPAYLEKRSLKKIKEEIRLKRIHDEY